MSPARGVVVAGLVLVIGLAGCSATPTSATRGDPTVRASAATTVFPAAQVDPLVANVVHRSLEALPAARLAAELVPPTNRWFSGLVFGDPQPVFPLPLSFGLTDTGVAFGQPKVVTTAKNIAGGYSPDVSLDLGAASSVISAYDNLTGDHRQPGPRGRQAGSHRHRGGLAVRGLSRRPGDLGHHDATVDPAGKHWTTVVAGVTYAMVVTDGTVTGTRIDLQDSGVATWFPVPTGGSVQALVDLAAHPLSGGSLDYSVGLDEVRTTVTYGSAGATAYARLPHQSPDDTARPTCNLGTYPSIYGTLTPCSGNELSWTAPLTQPTSALDVSALTADEKAELAKQVAADIAATPGFPADTYFGGKALYRAAMLYQLATQVGAQDAAASIKTRLVTTLDQWTDPRGCSKRPALCFVYDEQARVWSG